MSLGSDERGFQMEYARMLCRVPGAGTWRGVWTWDRAGLGES